MKYDSETQADILGELFTTKYESVNLNHWHDVYISVDANICGQYEIKYHVGDTIYDLMREQYGDDTSLFIPVERGSFAEHEINCLLDELGNLDKICGAAFIQLNDKYEVTGFYLESEK
jgi:hypothetical protein